VPIPWCFDLADDARRSFGDDWWPYGIEENRTTLTAFLRYAHEQGVTARALAPEELFAAEVQGRFKV
jgi:4,5-dihydroxyphthalate decarboxylase